MGKPKIVYFTKYTEAGPSSRYRSYQYKDYLEQNGFEVMIKPLLPTKYILDLYTKGKKNWIILIPKYLKRLFQAIFLVKYDIIFIEYELFPYAPLFLEKIALFRKKNIIFDFDDATFHTYNKSSIKIVKLLLGNKIFKLVNKAELVITGSPYLTEMLYIHSKQIIEIPTSISYNKYQKTVAKTKNECFIIGWIGSKNTSVNVLTLKDVFLELQKTFNINLHLVGFNQQLLPQLNGVKYNYIKWNSETEIDVLSSFDLGIMPLEDNYFNYGKCGFKLIQYMACGIPTVSTPLPANVKINHHNDNLFATSKQEWIDAIKKIILNKEFFKQKVGMQNKAIVNNYYAVETNYKTYVELFKKIISKHPIGL